MASKKATIQDEEDDLDELVDGVLDDFSTPPPPSIPTSSSTSAANTVPFPSPASDSELFDGIYTEEYAKQLEEFMKGLEEDEDFRQTFEELLKTVDVESNENGIPSEGGTVSSSSSTSGDRARPTPTRNASFQDKINQTIDKLQKSSDQVDAEVTEESTNELLTEIMKQMMGLAESGELQTMLEGMMEQIISKDILYDPIKELSTKYPMWLRENKDSISEEEYQRYEKQSEYVQKIVAHYEAAEYDENDEQQNKAMVDLMQKLQDYGQPPAEILGELAPGMELDEHGLPMLGKKCVIM